MKLDQDLNFGGLCMELESLTQLFSENWNKIMLQSLLFCEQFCNRINSIFILEIQKKGWRTWLIQDLQQQIETRDY